MTEENKMKVEVVLSSEDNAPLSERTETFNNVVEFQQVGDRVKIYPSDGEIIRFKTNEIQQHRVMLRKDN